ncbi:MAG: GNAT family N-acetyltransferase [Patescibacteria group bacterium]
MAQISLRYQQLKDARIFWRILNNPHFRYMSVKAKTLREEEAWLRANPAKRRQNREWNYAILLDGAVVGAIGIKINRFRPQIGEIGYFVAEEYWGWGITTRAVKLAEEIAFKRLRLHRLEIMMRPENLASERVAIKNKYRKEGRLKHLEQDGQGRWRDFWLYAKVCPTARRRPGAK